MEPSKVFISYSWEDDEHVEWVRQLATTLRHDGVDVKLDKWELVPGDQLPLFMEKMITENDFVLVICTPQYKIKSDNRTGGVGYEGDIMTGIKLAGINKKKFIPILRKGDHKTSLPIWLNGTYCLDFRERMDSYSDLHATLTNVQIKKAPALGRSGTNSSNTAVGIGEQKVSNDNIPEFKIEGVIVDEIISGNRDGSPGSGLDKIPLLLSGTPDYEWREIFNSLWRMPPSFSTMHRPRITSIVGNKLVLDGTTMEEIRDHHKATLKLVINETNNRYRGLIDERRSVEAAKKRREQDEKKKNDDIANSLDFD